MQRRSILATDASKSKHSYLLVFFQTHFSGAKTRERGVSVNSPAAPREAEATTPQLDEWAEAHAS